MIGTFTTRKYEDAEALKAGLPFEVVRSSNRFTNVGLEWLWKCAAGILRGADGHMLDHLGSARIVVGTGDTPFDPSDERLRGDETDQAELDMGYPRIEGPVDVGEDGGWRIVLRATFGEDKGLFDWRERGVVTAQGVLLDRSVLDQGRKVLGAIWSLEASLDLTR